MADFRETAFLPADLVIATQPLSTVHSSSADINLPDLLRASLVLAEDWNGLPASVQAEINQCSNANDLLATLETHQLLNDYQVARLRAGLVHGLVLGNYRVLDRIGAGAMGVVYKGEHVRMRRQVAIKVLSQSPGQAAYFSQRFHAEMRAVAKLHHPNIVGAFDAGEVIPADPQLPILHYYVMDYVPGQNLEQLVEARGPLGIATACDLIYQVCNALGEAHKHHLIHRDIKPSNILLTPDGQAILLDFGLVHDLGSQLTEAGTLLGTPDYMAPEQFMDAHGVDVRADIFALGGTLYWCLTGRPPFITDGCNIMQMIVAKNGPPPSARAIRPEVPIEVDNVLARMMATSPADRLATPQAVMQALSPLLHALSGAANPSSVPLAGARLRSQGARESAPVGIGSHRILIVDDEPSVRKLSRFAMQSAGFICDEAGDGAAALAATEAGPFDLVLLDIDMPGMSGTETLRHLRERPPVPHLKVIMLSGRGSSEDMAKALLAGADDYLAKPASNIELVARCKAMLRLKDSQDRLDQLNRHLLTANVELERAVSVRDSDMVDLRGALVLALSQIVEQRRAETAGHVQRLQRYVRCLSEEAATMPVFADLIDERMMLMLEFSVPLHDIGNVSLPDYILLKPGKFDAEERLIMQGHTVTGSDTLRRVAQQYGGSVAFLHMAAEVARHHHERYDGTGYPDRLAGDDIPLAARIVKVCDVYDALRSRRSYRPGLPHATAVEMMLQPPEGQFDPGLMVAFRNRATLFERIFREISE